MTSGQPNVECPSIQPAMIGGMAAARLRGTFVTLAAAGRSAGDTTAITYDVRAGTSICDSAARARRGAGGEEGGGGWARRRKEGGEHQEAVGREVGEHHRADEPDAVGDAH